MTAFPERWTPRRKAAVVADIHFGRVTAEEAAAEHGLSPEELQSWIDRHRRYGRRGLAVTRIQVLR